MDDLGPAAAPPIVSRESHAESHTAERQGNPVATGRGAPPRAARISRARAVAKMEVHKLVAVTRSASLLMQGRHEYGSVRAATLDKPAVLQSFTSAAMMCCGLASLATYAHTR